MSSDQLSEALYFAVALVVAAWRWYAATKRNAPEAQRIRLTSGYEKEIKLAGNKLSTDEWRRFIDREHEVDRSRDVRLELLDRNVSTLTDRLLHQQERIFEVDRRLFKLENSFEMTLQTLSRIEASQQAMNTLLVNLQSKGMIQ